MKNFICLFVVPFLVMISMKSLGQADLPITNQAIQQCLNRDLDGALITITAAITSSEEKNSPRAWYVKAFVHKEIFKTSNIPDVIDQHRFEAVSALEHCIQLDHQRSEWDQCKILLEFIAKHYLQDSKILAGEVNSVDDQRAENAFNQFRKVKYMADPHSSFTEDERPFNILMAQRYYDMWEKDVERNQELIRLSQSYYSKVLVLDSTDCEINYNLAVSIFNQGVYKIRRLGTTTEMGDLIQIQEESIKLFKKSLPLVNQAYQYCPERIDVLRAMYFINRSLDREEEAEKFRELMEQAIKEKKP